MGRTNIRRNTTENARLDPRESVAPFNSLL
jgi:hypothetical protein